ncbi:MAG: MBL fold metallo-hydrolase [Bacteroidetes bacterium]|nr:MBL fold metallo-hydrolase [Bacteroidota bacterium]
MKITFLGTGTSHGVPMIGCQCEVCKSPNPKDKRLRSSILVEVLGKTICVDSGPDFRTQMLREDVRHLDALLFTHEHKDHTAGLDDVRAFNYTDNHELDVFATPHVQANLKQCFAYIFADHKYPGVPNIKLNTVENKVFQVAGIPVIPIEVMHLKLPVLGFRFGDFTYITDANFISDEEKKKIYGSKYLVLNALRISTHISHFSLQEAIDLAHELGAEQTYFTHISHQLGLHDEVGKALPKGIYLAYDGLKIETTDPHEPQ